MSEKVEKRLIMSKYICKAMLEKSENVWKGWTTSDYVGKRQSRNLRKGQKSSDNVEFELYRNVGKVG